MGLPLVFLDLVALRAVSLRAELVPSALRQARRGGNVRGLEVVAGVVGA